MAWEDLTPVVVQATRSVGMTIKPSTAEIVVNVVYGALCLFTGNVPWKYYMTFLFEMALKRISKYGTLFLGITFLLSLFLLLLLWLFTKLLFLIFKNKPFKYGNSRLTMLVYSRKFRLKFFFCSFFIIFIISLLSLLFFFLFHYYS